MSLINDNAPSCYNCGYIMVPGNHVTHVCFLCTNCGERNGCSESLEKAAIELKQEVEVLDVEAEQ